MNGKDIIREAKKVSYRLDWRLKGGAIFVKGDKEGAIEIMDKLEREGWVKKERKAKIPGVKIYEYKSPDGKWKINYRTISSSEDKVEKAGYKVEATLDVIELDNIGRPKKGGTTEIKFILLKG